MSLGAASLRSEENVSADRPLEIRSPTMRLMDGNYSIEFCQHGAVGQRAEKLCHRAQTSLQLDRPNANCIIRLLADFEYLFNFIQLYDRAKESSGQQPSEAKTIRFHGEMCVACAGSVFGVSRYFFFHFRSNFFSLFSPRPLQ